MKSGDEMFQNILKRRNAYHEKKRKRIFIIKKTVSLAACFCFIISGYNIWQHTEKIPQSSIADDKAITDLTEFTDNTTNNQQTDIITTQPEQNVSTQPQQTEYSSYQPEDIQNSAVQTKPHRTETSYLQSQDFSTEIKNQQTNISADDVPPTVTSVTYNTENPSYESEDNHLTVTQPQQTEIITDDEPLPPGDEPPVDTIPPVTSACGDDFSISESIDVCPDVPAVEKRFELLKNVYDYNGEKWDQLIFTGADDNTEIHEHSFEIDGFTLVSEENNITVLEDSNGINYTIYMYSYDEFKIGLNPKSKSTYKFYEINGKQAVREICNDDYYIGIEYKPNLVAWDDGCHICFTFVADIYYNQVENLIKNQITY